MRAISGGVGVEEAGVRALAAGVDALCVGHDLHEETVDALIAAISEAARSGRLPHHGSRRRRVGWRRPHSGPPPATRRRAGARGRRGGSPPCAAHPRVTVLERDPFVVELVPEANIAAGEFVHGLADLWPGALSVRLDGSTRDAAWLLPARDRPLVIVARDALRHDWQQAIIWELLTFRPDAVVIETGIPGGTDAAIETYGAGRAEPRGRARRPLRRPGLGAGIDSRTASEYVRLDVLVLVRVALQFAARLLRSIEILVFPARSSGARPGCHRNGSRVSHVAASPSRR